ncbi:hypothetical protein [Yokenella regensburgei]|uniref:hypothetical protein n=1 Tax=Yokenella regensburgei TaxID=158877 RepID=UPI001432D102|nr:hypothetical protein [Yokenella regensburgei]QIU90499.1 hypothetical protein HEC60_14880 [Yokenella regensburgei]
MGTNVISAIINLSLVVKFDVDRNLPLNLKICMHMADFKVAQPVAGANAIQMLMK